MLTKLIDDLKLLERMLGDIEDHLTQRAVVTLETEEFRLPETVTTEPDVDLNKMVESSQKLAGLIREEFERVRAEARKLLLFR